VFVLSHYPEIAINTDQMLVMDPWYLTVKR